MIILKKLIKIILLIFIIALTLFILNYARINIRYLLSKKYYREEFDVQGIKDKYVPQGLAYNEKYNVVLQTSYNKEHKVSKLFITDFSTKKLIKEINLLDDLGNENTTHVGGIASNEDKIWITSDYKVFEYNLLEALKAEKELKALKVQEITLRGDFCYYENRTLWIGDFFLKHFYPVPDNDPKLYGYNLDNSPIIDYNLPDQVFSLPKMVQGIGIVNDKVLFSESFTYLINSKLEIYKNLNIADNTYTAYDKTNKVKTIKLPPMSEGFFIKEGRMYILFESASDGYGGALPKLGKIVSINLDYLFK